VNAMRELVRIRHFRWFWIGEAISVLGDQFYLLALPWLALELTDSPATLGAVLMAAAIPRAALMPVGGILVDRLSPQSLLLLSNSVRAVVVALLTALVFAGRVEIWHLFVLGTIFGAVDALSFPAFMSLTPRLVEERLLESANAAIQGTAQLAGMIGPAIAGVVIAAIGMAGAFAVDTASFVVSVVTLVEMNRLLRQRALPRATEAPPPKKGDDPVVVEQSAVRYTFGDPVLRSVLIIVASINLGVLGPVGVGLPALVMKHWQGSSELFGGVMAAFGAGTLSGTLFAALAPRPRRAGNVTSYATAALAASMLGLGLVIHLFDARFLVFPLLASSGAAIGYLNIVGISWLQARVPPHLMGRVMAFMVLAANGLTPFSYALSGIVAEAGVVPLFVAGGVAVTIAWLASRGNAFRNATWARSTDR